MQQPVHQAPGGRIVAKIQTATIHNDIAVIKPELHWQGKVRVNITLREKIRATGWHAQGGGARDQKLVRPIITKMGHSFHREDCESGRMR
jgi:hypothetical protein